MNFVFVPVSLLYDVGICRPLLISFLITFLYILVVVIASVVNINIITIVIIYTVSNGRYHRHFIHVDIVITVGAIITVICDRHSYHHYRHDHRGDFIFSLSGVS